MTQHWDGVDLTLNGRLQNGVSFQAGLSTGRDTLDTCDIVEHAPEYQILSAGGGNGQFAQEFCRQQEPWLTQFKAYGSYTVPKVDVQVALTFRGVPGMPSTNNPSGMRANFTATNAYLAANSNLGRNLAGTAAATQATSLEIVDPDTVYLDRDNQLDLRFGKVVRWRRTRSTINLDLFNALNANPVQSANASFAAWLRPTAISNPRLLKVSLTLDLN
jgi:hypothetical protein